MTPSGVYISENLKVQGKDKLMKMKRFAAALLALILCATLMTACSPKPEQPAATSGNATAAPTATPEATAEPTAEPTSAPTPTPPEATAVPEKTDTAVPATAEKNGMYDALCDLFQNYHPGTAGSSLTGARIAATIVDFSIANGPDAVQAGAQAFDLGEETEFGETFAEKLAIMYETAMGLYGENGKSLLTDSGYTPTHYPYTAKDVRDAYIEIFTARSYDLPAVVRVYRINANADGFLAVGVRLDGEEITADALNAAMNGLLFENGAAFHTVTVDEAGHIKADLNDAFAAQVRSFGTSGEYYLVGGVVNTLLDIYDGADVTLTVNGAPLESGHAVYDTALTRFAE